MDVSPPHVPMYPWAPHAELELSHETTRCDETLQQSVDVVGSIAKHHFKHGFGCSSQRQEAYITTAAATAAAALPRSLL
jgi:hypothetical protein